MGNSALPIEQFPALASWPHGFVGRIPDVSLSHDKAMVLEALDHAHRNARETFGVSAMPFMTARQVHGREIAVVDAKPEKDFCFEGCDGIATNQPGVCLGIYVADCAAVYLADRQRRAIALVHSGKKGTELGIIPAAVAILRQRFGVLPADLIVQLGPCIRPPHYEIDFAAEIVCQGRAAGIVDVFDDRVCTACDLEKYYSYRAERGKTGRMLAFLAM